MPVPWTIAGWLLFRFFEPELRAWFGLAPLWKVFWLRGVLASAVTAGFYLSALADHRLAWQQALLTFFAGYTIWLLAAVWRCAGNSAPLWCAIARSLTVAWAGNAALLVAFLEFDLVAASLKA